MFALVLMAFLILLAIASLSVLADSGLRWWSAFGALKQQLASADRTSPQAPTGARHRNPGHARGAGSHKLTPRAALRAAA